MKFVFESAYENDYFMERHTDPVRDLMYDQEIKTLQRYIPASGRILDIGCGLGNLLDCFSSDKWDKYGTEISEYAKQFARRRGIKFKFAECKNFFDVVIFRGTIQHLNHPFYEIETRIKQLKPQGIMAFLATPNAGSIYYRIFQDLPMLDPRLNFYIPSSKTLGQTLRNFGMTIRSINYPYLHTPYASPIKDGMLFLSRIITGKRHKHAFWGNMMEIYAQKPAK